MAIHHGAERPAAAHVPVCRTEGNGWGVAVPGATTARMLAVLRIATGFVFLWAFLDKLVGFGYATRPAAAWVNGGSPTTGFLGHVNVGPFVAMFHGWAGAAWADWLFMLGLAGIGVAVPLGVALRISAVVGTAMLLLMWAAEWPLAQHTLTRQPSGSTNPLVDYHVISALALIAVAATHAGDIWDWAGGGPVWAGSGATPGCADGGANPAARPPVPVVRPRMAHSAITTNHSPANHSAAATAPGPRSWCSTGSANRTGMSAPRVPVLSRRG